MSVVEKYLETIPFFSIDEFRCSCCGKVQMNLEFIKKLVKLRELLGEPVVLNSAYRCKNHPEEIKKKTPGFHTKGEAVDVKIKSRRYRARLIRLAYEAGITGIGVANNFVHLDNRSWDALYVYPKTK